MMESLQYVDVVPNFEDTRIPTVLDAYQRLHSRATRPPVIPPTLDTAFDTAQMWNATPTLPLTRTTDA
jgi:hypothetical protein